MCRLNDWWQTSWLARCFPVRVARLLISPKSYLRTTGLLHSYWCDRPANTSEALPWMNFPLLAFLTPRLTRDMRIFEYGCGNSTRFFAQRVGSVDFVEHDAHWFEITSTHVPDNVSGKLITDDVDGDYCKSVTARAPYDLIIVDGEDRVNCVMRSMVCLTAAGVLLLDDAQRPEYREVFDIMRTAGFRDLTFEGISPTGFIAEQTAIFYRPQNGLGI